MLRLLIVALALSAGAGAAFAQTRVSGVVVSPTLTPTPLEAVGSSVTLITGTDLELHQQITLPEALAAAPGLNLVETGGPGGLTSVFIRGANANHTEVLIDGVEVNDPSQNDVFDFGQALALGLARIEVLRGPQSSLYGGDALGGVISLTTPDGAGPLTLGGAIEGGSFATFDQSAYARGAAGPFHYALGLSHLRAGDTPVTPARLLAPGERAIGDRYDNLTATAKLGFDLAPKAKASLVVRWTDASYRSTGEDFAVFPAIPDAAQTRQRKNEVMVRAGLDFPLFDDRLANALGASYARFATTIVSPDEGFGAPAPVVDDGDRWKIDWLGTVRLAPRADLVLGVDQIFERLTGSASNARTGGFAELQARPLAGLSLAVSGRYDADQRFGGELTWRTAAAWRLGPAGTLLRTSAGAGFKAPTLSQLFVSFPAFDFFANPNLRPETSLGYDVGIEQPVGPLRIGATWFHDDIRNLIETDAAGTSWANLGRASSYGVETFAALKLGRLSLRADYTWTIARDDIARQELLRRPKNKASVSATWQASPRLRLAASLVYKGAWVDIDRAFQVPRLTASPYAVLNLSGDYQISPGLTLFARIDNALNRHFEEPVGFDKPGIGVFGGVRLALNPG
jgi:vitamin B12 transporter